MQEEEDIVAIINEGVEEEKKGENKSEKEQEELDD